MAGVSTKQNTYPILQCKRPGVITLAHAVELEELEVVLVREVGTYTVSQSTHT
jgi:hypothetical protein